MSSKMDFDHGDKKQNTRTILYFPTVRIRKNILGYEQLLFVQLHKQDKPSNQNVQTIILA